MIQSSMAYPSIERLNARGHLGIKRGLDNIRTLLGALGRPDAGFPVMLIAGTNGKGSTGAFLAHMLQAAGRVVGWTTSPHLVSVTERIWVDGHTIGEGALDLLLQEAFEVEAKLGIESTYFELIIVAALLAFRMTGVEIAVLEVGMGGRWDATNATNPILSVVTNVALDHQQYLGETREAIGREKLCVGRDGHPLVLGPSLSPDWVKPLLECEPVLHPAKPMHGEALHWDHSVVEGNVVGLAGAHQMDNLATAMEAVHQLRQFGFPIPEETIWQGVMHAQWPGRIWRVPGLDNVWMDGAHNRDGARTLANHAVACGVHPHLYFGAMGDKDLAGIAEELQRIHPRSLTFVQGDAPRYADSDALWNAWAPHLESTPPLLTVRQAAAHLRAPSRELRLITGSLYLMGDLLRELGIRPFD
jgi:dihydrofolate synthase / folylpolyglutamate synthase